MCSSLSLLPTPSGHPSILSSIVTSSRKPFLTSQKRENPTFISTGVPMNLSSFALAHCFFRLYVCMTIWSMVGFSSSWAVDLRALVPCRLLYGGPPHFLPHGPLHWAACNMASGFIGVNESEQEKVSEIASATFCNLISKMTSSLFAVFYLF